MPVESPAHYIYANMACHTRQPMPGSCYAHGNGRTLDMVIKV